MTSIHVEAKVLGRRKPLIQDWSVALPPELWASQPPSLRDLITTVVIAEVEAFHTRQAQRQLTQVLSATAIATGLAAGKVTSGEQEFQQMVDPQAAVDTAILGFIDGLYYVFVDDIQQEELEAPVPLKPESQVMFLRLVPLVGG
jgi:hypothetical protein